MPLGPFGEVVGTTGTLEALGSEAQNYKTKVVAPRNPKLVKKDEEHQHKMTPSKFLFDTSLSTEQKLANTHMMKIPRKIELLDMGDTSLQKFSKVNIDEPMFQPFPSEVYFQNFNSFEVYEVPLVLRNNDKVPRLVKVTQESSPYFKIISPNDVGHKVGPGLPTTFRIQFMPDEKKDYKHELICITEREKFVVPVRAVGARGILDFPDEIHFSTCSVKYPNTKTLLVRNIGNREARFSLKVDAPFTVSPDIGTLGVKDSMQVTLEFKAETSGDHKADLCLTYDTGEEIFIALYGAAQDVNVRLDKNSIRIENTYISMANQRTVVISNRSDVIAHFRWTKYATQDDEDQQKLLNQIELDREENSDTDRFLDECVMDPTLRDKLSILSRTFQNRKRAVENDPLLFDDDVVNIEPVEGDIWPNSSFEINVVFKPREAVSYTRTAYCDITGRENRLPLRIRGDGTGPKVDFSFDQLDMGNIFIGSKHSYEIVIANKGDIDAIYSVVPNTTIFGPCFAFNPAEGIVMPGGHQAIKIMFSSPYLGDFEETFSFQVDGQPNQSKVTFKGTVVGPSFNFDVAKLKFGTVPFGFLSSQICNLMNTSLVPMVFNLRVPGDGNFKSVCCTHDIQQAPMEVGPPPVKDAKEFEIIPSNGVIPPQSEIKVTVNLVPNTLKKYDSALVVDIDRVGEEIMSLPISAKSIVPVINNLTPFLNYGRCFLRHPYEHNIRLHNDTDLVAKYEIIPQDDIGPDDSPISYQSPQPKGILPAHSVTNVPLLIKANALEEQEVLCMINIFGSQDQPIPVHVTCVGEGPVVHVSPLSLDWGDIPVLQDNEKVLVLSNESFIAAKFTAHMLRPNTVFRVSPSEGEIPPEQSITIKVTANLDDCVRFQDKLQINFLESQARLIPLQGYGKGTTIVSDPPLTSILDLGPNFSNRPLIRKFKLTNRGRRLQQLVWLTDGYVPLSKAKKDKMKASANNLDIKKKSQSMLEPPTPIFQLTPNRMELQPGQSTDFSIEGFVNGPQNVSETIVCHAIIGRAGGKTPIISVDVKAEFIEPLLNFSTKCAFFRVDKGIGEELHMEQKQLVMNNVSSLPLTINLKLAYPFSMIIGGDKIYETEICLQPNDVYCLVIEFDPKFKDDCHIRTIDEVLHITYLEHPHIDYVALRGEVYFPNLEFEKSTVDFGCILNDTEVTRYINITNNSPMEVRYRWSFLIGDAPTSVKQMPRPKPFLVSEEELAAGEDKAAPVAEIEEEKEMEDIDKEQENAHDDSFKDDKENIEMKDEEEVESLEITEKMKPEKDVDETNEEDKADSNKRSSPSPEPQTDDETLEKGQLETKSEKEHEQELERRSGSCLSLREDEEAALQANHVLCALLEEEEDDDLEPIGVEQVFDILPLYGTLQPGDTEQVTFTFYGHAYIWGEVKAVCEVEGGPTYELKMTGEASLVEYAFDTKNIDYGQQMYDQVASASITLINTGKVGFEFSAINMDPALQKNPIPGQPVMIPHSGYIDPFAEQKLEVKFLPGVPEVFHKDFQIQVAHFQPDVINLTGQGVFPRVSLDLPRLNDEEGLYTTLLKEAKENLAKNLRKQQQLENLKKLQADDVEEELMKLVSVEEAEIEDSAQEERQIRISQHERLPSELEIQMEVERLAVRDFAMEQQINSCRSQIRASIDEKGENLPPQVSMSNVTIMTAESFGAGKPKPILPDYLLDFGYVVLGTVRTHVVRATNTGWFPVSFKLERQFIHVTGFHIELDRVRNLPGAPDNETLDFVVTFDPRGANLHLGAVEIVVPINVIHGPMLMLRLRAHVTMPDMEVSDDVLEFGEVKCGECKVITVQLHNHQNVKCEWDSVPPDDTKQIEKHVPMHLRRKLKQAKKKPRIFEVLPPTGVLMPGQRINVQVKFMPTEEKYYENRIPIRIAQSSQRILLLCHGQGLEPRLEFERTLVEFGPILPHSSGDDQEIIVHNPCTFPVEFYSLEFDNSYLEEEKVLRLMRGYDEYNTLLLPPRNVSEKLPQELLEFYDEQLKKFEEEEKARQEAEAIAEAERRERELEERESQENNTDHLTVDDGEDKRTDEATPAILTTAPSREVTPNELGPSGVPGGEVNVDEAARKEDLLEEKMKESMTSGPGVGELEITPVSAAIARHLGIDLTPEGKAARNRRGIALIVHGAPMSGKTSTAVAMAKFYEAALLTVDGVVCDAIANGNTPAGLRARELCAEAAKRKAEEVKELEGLEGDKKQGGLSVEAVTAHTQGTGAGAGTSLASNRKTSTVVDQKEKVKQNVGGKNTVVNSSIEGATGSQVPSSPPPLTAPIARRLSISASVAGEEGLISCVLPEDLLVEILAERLQLNDCHRGVVFDGLETLFSQTLFTTTNAVLKALNNRRFIYFVTLKLDYGVLKEQEKKAQEERELEQKQKEKEEILWLEEMDEDEYDALPDDIKAKVDEKRLQIKKERIKKEQEDRAERERQEREAREEEERRKEEEIKSRKSRKGKAPTATDVKEKDKKTQTNVKTGQGSDRTPKSQGGGKGHDGEKGPGSDRPESHATEKSDNQAEEGKKKKEKGKKESKKDAIEVCSLEEVRDPVKEAEMLLMQRFRTFEVGQKDIQDLLESWDRSALQPRRPSTPSERSDEDQKDHPASGKKGKGKEKHDKEKLKEQERLRLEKEMAEKAAKEAALAEGEDGETVEGEEEKKDEFGVPNILIDCSDKSIPPSQRIMDMEVLPNREEVLDGLGLGPQGPPIPPPATFAVVPYAVKRRPPQIFEAGGRYTFVASSSEDPNIGQDEKSKEVDAEDDSAMTPDKGKDDQPTPTKGKGAKGADKGRTSTEGKVDRKRSAERKKLNRRNSHSMQVASPPPGQTTPVSDVDNLRLTIFRWTVPAGGEIMLKLRFTSDDLGQFDQTLNFEIVGTRRRYQLFCRGVCAFPTISKEPRIVFPSRKKNRRSDEIVHKKYILMTESFEFGPLLVGKSRDKYREGKYPENMETFTILNTSPLEADISFCFLNDSKGETYLLEPPTMLLKPGESEKLVVWAYPKGPGHYEDAVVCCVRENPEPIVFKICCDGFRPELELDKKQLHFDRVLLHRKDTKTIYLRNSTQLPVAWKLSGLETLGDDYTVAADSGIVEPLSEYPLQAYFRAMKAVQTSKKMIRLEISDADNIMGVVHTEPIQVIAEAYDVALDLSFPKGTDGGIDFGTIRVNEEAKQAITLKNKGKYEISYNFVLQNPNPGGPDVSSLFTVSPKTGKLSALDRPTQVQVTFKSTSEVVVKDMEILKCFVIEPSLGEQGEIIASIPVKISVKAVFCKFNITPTNDINFGSLLVNSKKSRTFMIENKGEFDFKYTIAKKETETNAHLNIRHNRMAKGEKNSKSRDDSSSAPSAKPKKADSVRQDAGSGQSKLTLGMFTIFPAFGMILPNGNQVITVDCIGENQGKEIQDITIDITERDPNTHKGGIPYRLVAEACIPTINVDDVGSIFEEHRVCKNLSVWQHMNCGNSDIGGVFGEEEKKFIFNNVIVGRKAKARFKISNTNKVPCDVVFTLKPVVVKGAPKPQDVFDLDPPRMQIPNHSHMYATVTFTPPSMQTYSAIFEATIEGVTPNQARGKSLIFEISGEGNLPRITVAKPTVRNKRGQPLLLFKRILLGRSDSLPFELVNDGTLPSKVDIDLVDPDGVFTLKPTLATREAIGDIDCSNNEVKRRPHTASVIVNPTETATFQVLYKPNASSRSQANLKVSVIDNQYEDSVIQMVGEGYEDDITLDNIGSVFVPIDPEQELGSMADDDVAAAKPNLMQFGDCYVRETRTMNLTMTNHSKTDCVRFQWPDHQQLKFSPQVGHLHAGCTKDVAVTFRSDAPKTFVECPISCKVVRITFDKPMEQIKDWDDKIQVVKWVDMPPSPVQTADSGSKSNIPTTPQFQRPAKRKMIETEPEPQYTELPDSARNLELLISATADYTQCSCKEESVHFKDTLMFQTRVYKITLQNEGQVSMDYKWQVVMDNFTPTIQRSVTFMSEGERPESRVDVIDSSYIPFIVEPAFGTIPAGKTASCVVKFAPLDANDYEGRLIGSIPFMNKDEHGPVIGLKGKSLMPFCHFELEDSDYLSSNRRNPELRGPGGAPPGSTLDPNTRVIEFPVCGTGVRSYKEFGIVNPTNEPFSFEWICEDENDPKQPSCFKCYHPDGQVRSGRKFKVGFEFSSNQLDIVESFWRFVIPAQGISVLFLLVGNTREPDICLDRSHLNFKALLIGREAVETIYLTNREDGYFNFSFVEDSCYSEGYASHLKVMPMAGQIPPKTTMPINLHFAPTSEKEVNFNLRCTVPGKVAPITLNVKAEGYTMNCILRCEDSTGNMVELSERAINKINFGEVEVNEVAIRHLFVLNSGKFNFDYCWDLNNTSFGTDVINVSPQKGGVMCGETKQCALTFCPNKRLCLRNCELALKVANGPTYQISISGLGVTPGLHFSFRTFNFGNCFIHKAGLDIPTKQAVLRLTNKDKKEISVDCLYEPNKVLSHKMEARVILPNDTIDVPFIFCPRQAIKYHETVTFEVNGLSKQKVEFFGVGSEMKIEVADPKQKCVNLGAKVVGDNVKKYIPIVNNSPAPITFNLALTPSEPALQHKEILSISPKDRITLEPKGGTVKVEVWFRPKARIPQFTEEVLLECAGMSQPLFVLKGSCLGMEVSLDSDALSFGTVFQRSSSTRKLVMYNTGDMNTKFRWDTKAFKPDFSIHPTEGFITPGMEVTFDVEFHPHTISGDIRYDKLRCFLDDKSHKPVTLTLTGSCTGIPPVKEVQNFQAVVRQTDTKQLSISNKTNQLWVLKPIIDGEYWSGPVTFNVEPQQTKGYELTYFPLTMTSENKKHMGSIFFPMPDGSGLLFNLTGTAELPKAISKIQRDVPCKTSFTELLSVTNWLKKPQRFRVKTESLKPDKLDPGTTVKGVEYVDVPANGKKDYKLSFYAYREGQTTLKVTFMNESTGEFQFYELTFRATKPGTISTIHLTSPVRQSIPHTVTVENPLSYQVTFSISCSVPEVLMPNQLVVPANSQGHFSFEYQPLKVGEIQGRLELSCSDLGLYTYDLTLTATPGAPEKAIYFRTGLGSSNMQVAKFLNFAKQKTDYLCKIDNSDFHVDKSVAAAPGSTGGTEVALEIVFEPSKLGEQRALLTVSSQIGGEYIFPLFGTCIAPKPQGPFVIKAGSTTPIMFRNVFGNTTPYTFQVDNPLFHLTKQGESIRSKKDHRIVVGFDGNDSGSRAAVMGKLIVSCARSAGGNSNVQWIYYLKGITP